MILKYISEFTVGGVTTPRAHYTHLDGITCRWNMDGLAIALPPNITCCHNGVVYTNATTLTYECLSKSRENNVTFYDAERDIITCKIFACLNNEGRGNYLVTATRQFQQFCRLIKMEEDIITGYYSNNLSIEILDNYENILRSLTLIPNARKDFTLQLIEHYRAIYIQTQLLTNGGMSDAWYNHFVSQYDPQLF